MTKGIADPKSTDRLYEIGVMAETVAIAFVDADELDPDVWSVLSDGTITRDDAKQAYWRLKGQGAADDPDVATEPNDLAPTPKERGEVDDGMPPPPPDEAGYVLSMESGMLSVWVETSKGTAELLQLGRLDVRNERALPFIMGLCQQRARVKME